MSRGARATGENEHSDVGVGGRRKGSRIGLEMGVARMLAEERCEEGLSIFLLFASLPPPRSSLPPLSLGADEVNEYADGEGGQYDDDIDEAGLFCDDADSFRFSISSSVRSRTTPPLSARRSVPSAPCDSPPSDERGFEIARTMGNDAKVLLDGATTVAGAESSDIASASQVGVCVDAETVGRRTY